MPQVRVQPARDGGVLADGAGDHGEDLPDKDVDVDHGSLDGVPAPEGQQLVAEMGGALGSAVDLVHVAENGLRLGLRELRSGGVLHGFPDELAKGHDDVEQVVKVVRHSPGHPGETVEAGRHLASFLVLVLAFRAAPALVLLFHGRDIVDHGDVPGDLELAVADRPDEDGQPPYLAAAKRESLAVALPEQAGRQAAGAGLEGLALIVADAVLPAAAE